MHYLACLWHHSDPAYPVELYSELDDERNEIRKVEVFADGRRDFAGPTGQSGETELSYVQIPILEEIAAQPEFTPREITADEFEAMWALTRVC